MRPLDRMHLIAGMLSLSAGVDTGRRAVSAPSKGPRPCIQCKHLHSHNNSFCSADCCRAYKAAKMTHQRIGAIGGQTSPVPFLPDPKLLGVWHFLQLPDLEYVGQKPTLKVPEAAEPEPHEHEEPPIEDPMCVECAERLSDHVYADGAWVCPHPKHINHYGLWRSPLEEDYMPDPEAGPGVGVSSWSVETTFTPLGVYRADSP